jgi:hypothetical protein
MSRDWLSVAGFVVQCLIFVGLVWYTFETRRIRKTSQDQIEATQKPCLAFSTTARDFNDAVLDRGDVVGAMTVLCPEGLAQLENVGCGSAVNVQYELIPTDPASTVARLKGYVIGMRPGEKFQPPIPQGILANNEWQCVLTYESLSGRRYETKVIVNNLVLTSFRFGPAARPLVRE